MFKSNFAKFLCLALSFAFFNLNASAANIKAKHSGLVSTIDMVKKSDRAQAERELHELVSKEEVQSVLKANGLNESEIKTRIAGLSDRELAELKGQIDKAQAGGILVTILVVLLIIYLAQRI